MYKSIVYTISFFLFLGSLLILSLYMASPGPVILSGKGLQFTRISQSDLAFPAGAPIVFTAKNNTETGRTLYFFPGFDGRHEYLLKSKQLPPSVSHKTDYILDAIQGNLEFDVVSQNLSEVDWIKQVHALEDVQTWQLIQHRTEAGFFGFLDDSPLIFLLIGFIAFLLIWFTDLLGLGLKALFPSIPARLLVQIVFLMGFFFFLNMLNALPWYPNGSFSNVLRNSLLISISFAGFYGLNQRYVQKMDFPNRALVQFVYLTVVPASLLLLFNEWLFLLDSTLLEEIYRKPFRANNVPLGMIFSFAMGNLANMFRQQLIQLNRNKQLLSRAESKALASSAALQSLQASINPHFLYNSLNAIAAMAKSDAEKTEEMTLALSAFYRYVNQSESQHVCTLKEEMDMIHNYLKIEQIRFEDQLKVEIECSDDAMKARMPRFILQPLLENAIKHGFGEGQIWVRVEAAFTEGIFSLKIYDKGKAFDENVSMGFGLYSIAQKLRLLFPDKHQLTFVNAPKKHVYIQIVQS